MATSPAATPSSFPPPPPPSPDPSPSPPLSVSPTPNHGDLNLLGTLTLRGNSGLRVAFDLRGSWSELTGELSMVGNGVVVARSNQGTSISPSAVLKLNYTKTLNLSTIFTTGVLESLDAPNISHHFDPISLVAYRESPNYEYTQIAEAESFCSSVGSEEELLGFDYTFPCFRLKAPLEGALRLESRRRLGFGHNVVFLNQVHCMDDGKVHMYVVFSNQRRVSYHSFVVGEKALVGEGFWDHKKNRLCIVACNVVSSKGSILGLSVGDCSFRMSLWFSALWSIRSSSSVQGRIWSVRREDDLDGYSMMSFWSIGNFKGNLRGLTYNYTMADSVKKSCAKDGLTNRSAAIFPDGRPFRDLRLWFSVINTEGEVVQGYGAPVTIEQVVLGEYSYPDESSHSFGVDPFPHKPWGEMHIGVVNVSYKICYSFQTGSLDTKEPTEISAEGTYNSGSGLLCLIGCRHIGSFEDAKETRIKDSMDCEINTLL